MTTSVRAILGYHYVAKMQVTVGAAHVLEGEALHLDALDELLVVGIKSV